MLETKKQFIKDYFSDLEFYEDTHTYLWNGQRLDSVSKNIKNYIEAFDSQRISHYVAMSRGITQEEVLQEWEDKKNEACDLGTSTHLFAEKYFEDQSLLPENKYQEAVVKFWNTIPDYITPVFSELKMYSELLNTAGTADLIFYNSKTDKFILMDFKTNRDLFKNYKGKTMCYPFEDLLDNPFNKYQIQLSYYKYLFEQTGFEIERCTIIWLLPSGDFRSFNTTDYIDRLI